MKTERNRLDLCSGEENGKWTLAYGLVSLRSSQIFHRDQFLKINLMLNCFFSTTYLQDLLFVGKSVILDDLWC